MNQTIFAFEFKNGVYLSKDNKGEISDTNKQFIPKDTSAFEKIDKDMITYKHLDLEFDNKAYSHWSKIETPWLEKIFHLQNFDDEIKKWIYVLLGRLFYPLGHYDEWALAIFLNGVAKSGKSELLNLMAYIMGESKVVSMLSEPHAKLVILDELPDKTMDLRTMIDGIKSTIADKSTIIMTARDNPFPPDEHAAEHVFAVKFSKSYDGEDLNLQKDLRGEAAKILRKCNEAYLQYAPEIPEIDELRAVLPDFFTF